MEGDLTDQYKPVRLKYSSCSTILNHNCEEPPIILMHGLFGNSSTWIKVKCPLSNKTGRKVYTLELRNHGGSGWSDEYSLKHMVADLLQFMKDEKLSKAILVGHSLSGKIAMELALLKPEMVELLIVEDAILSDQQNEREILSTLVKSIHKIISQLPVTMSITEAQKMVQRIFISHLPKLSKDGGMSDIDKAFPFFKDSKTGKFKFPGNQDVLVQYIDNMELLLNDVSNNAVYPGKTLFIKGEHSLINWEMDKGLFAKHFPDSEFYVMRGANHLAHFEKPDDFTDTVSDFIRSCEKNRSLSMSKKKVIKNYSENGEDY